MSIQLYCFFQSWESYLRCLVFNKRRHIHFVFQTFKKEILWIYQNRSNTVFIRASLTAAVHQFICCTRFMPHNWRDSYLLWFRRNIHLLRFGNFLILDFNLSLFNKRNSILNIFLLFLVIDNFFHLFLKIIQLLSLQRLSVWLFFCSWLHSV